MQPGSQGLHSQGNKALMRDKYSVTEVSAWLTGAYSKNEFCRQFCGQGQATNARAPETSQQQEWAGGQSPLFRQSMGSGETAVADHHQAPQRPGLHEQKRGVGLAQGLAGSPPPAAQELGHPTRAGRAARLPASESAFQSRQTMTAWPCVALCLREGVRLGRFLLEVSIWQASG